MNKNRRIKNIKTLKSNPPISSTPNIISKDPPS